MVRIYCLIAWSRIISWPDECSWFHFMALLFPWTWIESSFNLSSEAFNIYMSWDSTNLFLLLKDRFIQQEDALDISCFLYNFDLETFFVRFDIFPLYNYINGYRLFPICVPHFIMNFSEPYIICRKPRISHEVQIYLQSLLNFFK